MDRWEKHRSSLIRLWWTYMLIAAASAAIFIWSWQTRDSILFGVLLLIPLLSLRKAWRIDQQIRDAKPIIGTEEIS